MSKPRGMFIWGVTLCDIKSGKELPAGTVLAKTSAGAKKKAKAYVRKTFGGSVLGETRKSGAPKKKKLAKKEISSIALIKKAYFLIKEGHGAEEAEEILMTKYGVSASRAWDAYLNAQEEIQMEEKEQRAKERGKLTSARIEEIEDEMMDMMDENTSALKIKKAIEEMYPSVSEVKISALYKHAAKKYLKN